MTEKIKVLNKENLVRDTFSKALINIDRNAYLQSKNKKKNDIDRNNKIVFLEKQIEILKSGQLEIIKLLTELNKNDN